MTRLAIPLAAVLSLLVAGMGGLAAWHAPAFGVSVPVTGWRIGFEGGAAARLRAAEADSAAVASDLATCRDNTVRQDRTLATQTAAIVALRLQSDARLAAAERAEADSARRAEDLKRRVSALMSREHAATDPYERVLEGRAWILEDLQ